MAIYKEGSHLTQLGNPIFDEEHPPGTLAPRAGIYQCPVCGREVTAAEDAPLPSEDHHVHAPFEAAPCWKLIVFADHRRKRGSEEAVM
jgi:hypothetical protein